MCVPCHPKDVLWPLLELFFHRKIYDLLVPFACSTRTQLVLALACRESKYLIFFISSAHFLAMVHGMHIIFLFVPLYDK